VLGFLVVDENFEIIKVSLTVITPWPSQDLLNIGVLALRFTHDLHPPDICNKLLDVTRSKRVWGEVEL